MKNIQSIKLNDSSKEELLPGFSPDFPYIATCAELDKYLEHIVPWHCPIRFNGLPVSDERCGQFG